MIERKQTYDQALHECPDGVLVLIAKQGTARKL